MIDKYAKTARRKGSKLTADALSDLDSCDSVSQADDVATVLSMSDSQSKRDFLNFSAFKNKDNKEDISYN